MALVRLVKALLIGRAVGKGIISGHIGDCRQSRPCGGSHIRRPQNFKGQSRLTLQGETDLPICS